MFAFERSASMRGFGWRQDFPGKWFDNGRPLPSELQVWLQRPTDKDNGKSFSKPCDTRVSLLPFFYYSRLRRLYYSIILLLLLYYSSILSFSSSLTVLIILFSSDFIIFFSYYILIAIYSYIITFSSF
mgnify:CR=1 FL=1